MPRYAITFETAEPLDTVDGTVESLLEDVGDASRIIGTPELSHIALVPLTLPQDGDVGRVLGFAEQFLDDWAEDARQHGDAPDRTAASEARSAYDRSLVLLRRAKATRQALHDALPMLQTYTAQLQQHACEQRSSGDPRHHLSEALAQRCVDATTNAAIALQLLP